jgi:accessory gene regulator protein AgrB
MVLLIMRLIRAESISQVKNLTSVAPIFSMTGILYPANRRKNKQLLRTVLEVHGYY